MKTPFLPAPKSVDEAMSFAKTLASSQLVPKSFQNRPQDIFVAMLWSHNLDIPVIQGLQYIAVVNGRPTMYGDGALAVVTASGLLEDIKEEIKEVQGGVAAICTLKRKGRATPITRIFTQAEAVNAGLWTKPGPWSLYPKRMLQMRARAFALRDGFPDVLSGMGIYEEQADVVDGDAVEVKHGEQPVSEKPERKMPRKKSAPKAVSHDPSPTIEDVTGKTTEEILEPVKEPIAEPAQAAVVEEETMADAPSSKYFERIHAAKSRDELVDIFKSIPAAERTQSLIDLMTKRRDELGGA